MRHYVLKAFWMSFANCLPTLYRDLNTVTEDLANYS